ncbi:unnamed protein product [Closterium sp. Naga37s-1]|nr:unnamed protein product [Closterium sp. Naga37s-1]
MGNQTSVVDALVDLEFPTAAAPAAARLPPGHDLPMGVLSFEVASLMRKALDLWRQLDARNTAGLEKQLQTEGLKRLCVGDYSLRWRLAGAEYASDLTALTAAVGMLARRSGGARSGEVLKRLRGYSRAWKREDSFSEGEADELMRFLREQLEPMGALHNAMLALDDVINSSAADPEVQNPKARRPKGKPQAAVMEQMQVVHQLQRASLWNHPLERPVLMLAVSIGVLWQQYRSVFGRPAPPKQEELKASLGAAGLPSVYARVLLGVEQMREMSPISQPFKEQRRELYGMTFESTQKSPTRRELYGILPSTVRWRLAKRLKQRSKRQIDGGIAKDLKGVVGDILRRELYSILPSTVRRRLAKRLKQRFKRHIDGGIAKDLKGVLYSILPSTVRRRLAKRLKQRSKRQIDGGIAKDLKGVVGDILRWAVPLAERTEVWNGDKSFGTQRRNRGHRTLLVETLHYCDKDKFEAVLVELLTSFSLVTLHFRRANLQPHPPSKARPPSAPIRRKQPGSAEPKNQAARPSTAPAFPPSASAPTFTHRMGA